ncbi:heavy-metal-associated domain-containing protein [Pseudarthrobacter sp. NPDC058196]|uniref:heavy-metal-associated domain-containing protein n=1 Tax=Pseudarthrobacter sp. NPDC058196 TaxID=3346376 RepID=UPI0036D80423
MCGTSESRTQLPLASTAQQGCGCCSPAVDSRPATAAEPAAQGANARYDVEGLTCGHCVRTVEQAVSGVAGVESATVDLVPGGTSRLTVTGTADREALAEAVSSSGYVLAGAN